MTAISSVDEFIREFKDTVGEPVRELRSPYGVTMRDLGNGLTLGESESTVIVSDGEKIVAVERTVPTRIFVLRLLQAICFRASV